MGTAAEQFRKIRNQMLADAKIPMTAPANWVRLISPTTLLASLILHCDRRSQGEYSDQRVLSALFQALATSHEALASYCDARNLEASESLVLSRLWETADWASVVYPEYVFASDELEDMEPAVFVDTIYRIYLDRRPDPPGLRTWTAALTAGLSRFDAISQISRSSEAEAAATGRSLRIVDVDDLGARTQLEGLRRHQMSRLTTTYEYALLMNETVDMAGVLARLSDGA